MFIPDLSIAVSIAILYSLFFLKLSDIVFDKKKFSDMCPNSYELNALFNDEDVSDDNTKKLSKNEKQECEKQKNVLRSAFETKKFATLLSAGLVALVLSYFVDGHSLIIGFALAGVITTLNATVGYWSNLNEISKLIMVGISLGLLILSPKLIKNIYK